jgi:hypothetical protein
MHIQPDTPALGDDELRLRLHRYLPLTITTAVSTAIGSGWAKRHQRIRAHSATGQVAGAAIY